MICVHECVCVFDSRREMGNTQLLDSPDSQENNSENRSDAGEKWFSNSTKYLALVYFFFSLQPEAGDSVR